MCKKYLRYNMLSIVFFIITNIHAQDTMFVAKKIVDAGMSFETPRLIKKNGEKLIVKELGLEDKVWVPIIGGVVKSGVDQEVNTRDFYRLQIKSSDLSISPEGSYKLRGSEGIMKLNLNWGF